MKYAMKRTIPSFYMDKSLVIILICMFSLAACTSGSEKKPLAQYSIEQLYESTRVSGGAFSEDESKLLVTSNKTGINNLFEIDIASGEQTQITQSAEESYYTIGYVPGTGEVLYSADKGGNENNHIYLHKKNGESTDLTPGENEKASFGGWTMDKSAFYYTSNKRNPQFFDLYKMKTGEWTSSLIYQNEEGYLIGNLSDDERYISVTKRVTTSEDQLYLIDLIDNTTVEISVKDAPGAYQSSDFSKKNKTLFYTTNADKEFTYLKSYNIETGSHQTVYETSWDVMYSYLSKKGSYRVIGINEDGKNNLVILDNTTNAKIPFPAIPDGDIIGLRISDSEKYMRLTVGSSKSPANIYVYNFETQDLKKLTNTLNKAIAADDLVDAEVIRYASFDGLQVPAIYYKPHQANKDNKVPALIWVHGGPGGQSRTGYSEMIQYLVNHGYAVLAVNNRGSSGYGKSFYKMDDRNHGDKDLKDCIWGKKWLADKDYIDENSIGILGGSYGGYMTMAAMAFEPTEFKVGVNLFGVTNWMRTLKSIPAYWASSRKALYKEIGDPFTDDSVRLYNISPLFHAEQIQNPVMVLQGANDPRVFQVESDEIVEAMKTNNVPVEYVVFPDEGHGFVKKENQIESNTKILKFLDTYLKGKT